MVTGPLRVFPGKLSVTRTFGDIEAKDEKLGGNNKVVVVEPEIKHFNIKPNHDFIVLGSDGVFDKMESKDVVKVVWQTVEIFRERNLTIHELLSVCVEEILREVMNRRSLDNITVVMIGNVLCYSAFKNFENTLTQMQQERTNKDDKRKE
jgi:protein phosphatase 2C family protein 2/3